MSEINPQTALTAFLISQFNKKTEKEQKQLEKAKESQDLNKIAELEETLSLIRDKFSAKNWLVEATEKMAKQLYFGTHISKGIHPNSKGDNVAFVPQKSLDKTIVGSHSISSNVIDANGNAAALPLAAFFDFSIDENQKIRDLILNDNEDFIYSLSDAPKVAENYHQIFKQALLNPIEMPVTDEANKQILWAIDNEEAENTDNLNYHNIIPLYPSVFTHEIYQRINHARFSDENKQARDNRFKKTALQKPYKDMLDLAMVKLGGTKPQNISQLMSKQGGTNYLLPSLPPVFNQTNTHFHLSTFSHSIFDSKTLTYRAEQELTKLFNVIESEKNNRHLRKKRQQALDNILHILFEVADDLRTHQPAGWSKAFQLNLNEKLWLDPKRASLPDENDFQQQRLENDWHSEIIHSFARWINRLCQNQFPKLKSNFGDSEHLEWESEISEMVKLYERLGKGVFL